MFLTKASLEKINISQGTGWCSSLVYLDHGNKETLNLLDILKQNNLIENGQFSVFLCENDMFLTKASLEKLI